MFPRHLWGVSGVFPGVSGCFREFLDKMHHRAKANTKMDQYVEWVIIVVNQNVNPTAATPADATNCKSIITDRVFPAWGATPLYITKRRKGFEVQR